jgi:hypothetical protein
LSVILLPACTFTVDGVALRNVDLAVPAGDAGMDFAVPPDAPLADLRDATVVVLGRRKSISIDDSKVSGGNQSNFPVWIDLTDADIAARARLDGKDIYFTAADGTTKLDFEIQRWDRAAQRLSAWVRVPTLSGSNPTVLYLYYGDALGTENAAGVFSSSFAAVWHLEDRLPATMIVDATGARTGTPSFTTTTQVTAKLGGGLAFTGGNDTIAFTNPLTGNQAHTISVWISQQTTTHPSAVLVVGNAVNNQSRWFYTHFMAPVMAIGFYGNDWTTAENVDNAGFVLIHWVFEGSNGRNRIYRNGVEISGSPQTLTGTATQGTTGIIGHAPEPAYGTNMGLLGTVDELRIATTARTAGWVATEYANQSSPATFYTVGPEQPAP